MIEIAKPANLNPTLLWKQMKDAGLKDTNWMYANPDENGVSDTIKFLDLDESDRTKLESIFAEHSAMADAEEIQMIEHATNENTIRDRMDNSLATLKTDIQQNDAWLAANQSAPAIQKELVRQSTTQAKALLGIVRTLRNNFEAVE